MQTQTPCTNSEREGESERSLRMSSECPGVGKSSWPELVGKAGYVAATTIKRENPNVTAVIVPPDSVITPDIRCDRVRVFVDAHGTVTRVPVVV